MEINCSSFKRTNITALFMTFLLFVYALCYNPFITPSYVPVPIRISLEGLVLFLALILNVHYVIKKSYPWIVTITILFACFPIIGTDTALHVVSSYNKLIFLILVIGILSRSNGALELSVLIWINLWRLLCCLAIIAFIGYITGLIHFSWLEFIDIDVGAPYTYIHNAVLGNIVPRYFFGIEFGRVAGYMYEPGLIGYFYGFNILVARKLIHNDKSAKKFIMLNFAAGLTTFSMSLIYFLVIYIFVNLISVGNKYAVPIKVILLIPIFLYITFYTISSELMQSSSSLIRISRFQLGIDIINNNTLITSLFGNGIGFPLKEGMGISSGPMNILVERGAIMLLFLGFMFFKFSIYNRWLLFYILYYSFMFEMCWYPIFLLGIAIAFAATQRLRYGKFVSVQMSTYRPSCYQPV